MSIQQFCLRWNNHQPNFISVFTTLLNNESLVDVTLAAEGKHLQAHKVVLSACSVYFQTLFTANPSRHPIVILKDVKYADLRIMVDFMYYGEVNVSQEQLPQILETAKMLKIKGLTEMPDSTSLTKAQSTSSERADLLTPGESSWGSDTQRHSTSPCNLSPSMKRKRLRKTSTGSGSTSIEKSAEDKHFIDHSAATLNLVKTDSITLSSVPQHNVKIKTKELQYSDFQTPKESLDENGGVDNSISLNTDETSNCLMRGVEPSLDDPAANLSQQGQREKLMNKRGKLLIRQHRIKKDSESMASTPDEEASTSEFVSSIIQRQVSEPILPSVKAMHLSRGNYVKKQYSHSTPYSHMQNTIKFCGVNTGSSLLPFSIILESNDILPSCTSSAVNLVKESVVCDVDPPSTSSEAPSGREQPIIENVDNTRSSHCPVIRPGPSLSCNYCWNTVDDQGRILRRKTKYHCPECQVNLCIVPCFHEYHERNVT